MNLFRLTYRHTEDATGDGTHEWRAVRDLRMAEALAKQARGQIKKQKVGDGNRHRASDGNRHSKTDFPVTEIV